MKGEADEQVEKSAAGRRKKVENTNMKKSFKTGRGYWMYVEQPAPCILQK